MTLDVVEAGLRWLGGGAAAAFLAAAFYGLWRAGKRPRGRASGLGRKVLRMPFYVIVGVGFFGVCVLLWRPLPLSLSAPLRLIALLLGSLLWFGGLGLWWWARHALGEMFNASSALGAQLYADHRLITTGPYALVRHPMYLSEIIAAFGGLFLYQTWACLFVAVGFLGLVLRARREEQALAAEFGGAWEDYCRNVPAWLPRAGKPARHA